MSYVPTPIIIPFEDDFPRVRELARDIQKVLEDYRERNPMVTDREVAAALRVSRASRSISTRLIATVIAGALALGVAAVMALLFVTGG